jgi:hypothetical protein
MFSFLFFSSSTSSFSSVWSGSFSVGTVTSPSRQKRKKRLMKKRKERKTLRREKKKEI